LQPLGATQNHQIARRLARLAGRAVDR
jgi:hypothetical protein